MGLSLCVPISMRILGRAVTLDKYRYQSARNLSKSTRVLRELLDVVVGDSADNAATTFAERFHLFLEPPRVRFSFLDEVLRARVCWPVPDCSVPAPTFAGLKWTIPRVLIVENRDVFLCLPKLSATLAIFGSGKGSSLLGDCQWLNASEIVYWGDCDESGYGILSSLRSRFPHVRSILMDQAAWQQWKHLAVPGRRDSSVKHSYLNVSERAALTAVLAGPWMLEQERIPLVEAERAIAAAFDG